MKTGALHDGQGRQQWQNTTYRSPNEVVRLKRIYLYPRLAGSCPDLNLKGQCI